MFYQSNACRLTPGPLLQPDKTLPCHLLLWNPCALFPSLLTPFTPPCTISPSLTTYQVNGIDLRQATHDEAIGVLRLTTQRVHMCVFRHQEAYREEDLWDVFSLELRPRPGEGLGFTTVGKRYYALCCLKWVVTFTQESVSDKIEL